MDTQNQLVASQTAAATAYQRRVAVANPFALRLAGQALHLALVEGGKQVGECYIGELVPAKGVGGVDGYIVEREGVSMSKHGTAQTNKVDAAYYALRNLMSRAAERDLGEAKVEAATLKQKLTESDKKAEQATAQTAFFAAIMSGNGLDAYTQADATRYVDDALRGALPKPILDRIKALKAE